MKKWGENLGKWLLQEYSPPVENISLSVGHRVKKIEFMGLRNT